jgi:hypothetical protein
MKPRVALAAVALLAVIARVAWAEPGSPAAPYPPPKRPLPVYGEHRPRSDAVRDVLLWVPRVILSPLYFVSEYVIRRPLSLVIPAAESAELPRKIRDFFLFGPDHEAGIVPVGYAEFGFNPSVGVFGFWNDAFAKDNDWSLHAEAWPTAWYAFTLKESARIDGQRVVRFELTGIHRPDRVFYGIGPRTLESSQSRFTEAVADENVTLDWRPLRDLRLQVSLGLRSESLGPGAYGTDPSLEREATTGVFPVPYGFDGRYTAEYNRVVASFDSRRAAPAPGSGVRGEARLEQGSNLLGTPESGWIRYGATAGAFADLDGFRHVLGLSVTATFADPLGDRPVPFTELASLGGEAPMLGFFPRRMLDRSAAAAALHYAWPVAPGVSGSMEAAVGNAFDQHLQGFRPDLLRFSGDIGLATPEKSGYPIEATIAIGSETFEHGGQIDSVRFKVSVNHGF